MRIIEDPRNIASHLPDNSRRPKKTDQPRNIGIKTWIDSDQKSRIEELVDLYGSSESAMIRWLIELGEDRVKQLAKESPIHNAIHMEYELGKETNCSTVEPKTA